MSFFEKFFGGIMKKFIVILVVLCGFLAFEGQAKKVKGQCKKVSFDKISSGGLHFYIIFCCRQLLSKKHMHRF